MPEDEIERWFADAKLPLEPITRRVREVILAADPRITEFVKNRTLTFGLRRRLRDVRAELGTASACR